MVFKIIELQDLIFKRKKVSNLIQKNQQENLII